MRNINKSTGTVLLLLCLLLAASVAKAQDSTIYRHHIGLNTRVVLDRITDSDSRTPLQLIYKYQLSAKSAIRVMAEGFYAKSDSSQSYTDRRDELTHYTYGGSVGYERQKPLNKTFMIYYGADAFYRRQGKRVEILDKYQNLDQNQEEVYVDDRYSTTAFGLRPFVGFRANVGRRLYLSTDTSLFFGREKSIEDGIFNVTVTRKLEEGFSKGTTFGKRDYTTNRTIITYIPINGLNLQYLF